MTTGAAQPPRGHASHAYAWPGPEGRPVGVVSPGVPGVHTMRHASLHPGRRVLVHRPHRHRDRPVRLDDLLPHRRQDDLAVWACQVIVPLLHVRSKNIHLQESLLDELLHALFLLLVLLVRREFARMTYRPRGAEVEWKAKLSSDCILELDGRLVLLLLGSLLEL